MRLARFHDHLSANWLVIEKIFPNNVEETSNGISRISWSINTMFRWERRVKKRGELLDIFTLGENVQSPAYLRTLGVSMRAQRSVTYLQMNVFDLFR